MTRFPRIPLRYSLAAATLIAAAAAIPAHAQDIGAAAAASVELGYADTGLASYSDDIIVMGAITGPRDIASVEDPADRTTPVLPVVYEDEQPTAPATKAPATR